MRRCAALLTVTLAFTLHAEEPAKPLPPAEAAKKINEKCIVEMEVKSARTARSGKIAFLNSEEDYRSPKNFTVLIEQAALKKLKKDKIDDAAAHYKGKTIRVTGTVKLYREKPEIVVDDPLQIVIVEKK